MTITDDLRTKLDTAIGGEYHLPDSRSFWVDAATVREILRRITPVLEAAERVRPQPQSSPREVGEGDFRDALKAAYIAGASDVVTYGKPERHTDDFGEAASDYVASICAALPSQSPPSRSDDRSVDL